MSKKRDVFDKKRRLDKSQEFVSTRKWQQMEVSTDIMNQVQMNYGTYAANDS